MFSFVRLRKFAILHHVFKISTISSHARFESCMPLVNGWRQWHCSVLFQTF